MSLKIYIEDGEYTVDGRTVYECTHSIDDATNRITVTGKYQDHRYDGMHRSRYYLEDYPDILETFTDDSFTPVKHTWFRKRPYVTSTLVFLKYRELRGVTIESTNWTLTDRDTDSHISSHDE